ncbi:hypothetical protein [Streptomyces albidochromogenes]|uniref:Secreted protein n=1 Tax=Streptomyces albidochromogenes TaxID=329524 RepID=A0ABW6FD13_9ACTN
MRKAGVAVAASVAAMAFAATPATAVAAYPTSDFSIEVGASYYKGTATWYNRAVEVNGAFKATGCRRVYARAFTGTTSRAFESSSTWCDRSGPARLGLDVPVAGGADHVWVYMTDGSQNYLEGMTCYRGYDYCIDGLHH